MEERSWGCLRKKMLLITRERGSIELRFDFEDQLLQFCSFDLPCCPPRLISEQEN